MCGIFCNVSRNCETSIEERRLLPELFKNNILNRGPDQFGTRLYCGNDYTCFLAASVLWLQGIKLAEQPIENDLSIFVYNGDIYDGLEHMSSNFSDTVLLHNLLDHSSNITEALCSLNGPFAFIYLDKSKKEIYFCRDIYGRRSLLLGINNNSLIITSVAARTPEYKFIELPAIGVFSFNLENGKISLNPWRRQHKNFLDKLNEVQLLLGKDVSVKGNLDIFDFKAFKPPNTDDLSLIQNLKQMPDEEVFKTLLRCDLWIKNVNHLKELISKSIQKRILKQPKYCHNCIKDMQQCSHATVGILFSGGVDCAILALLADSFVDQNRPIDLLNVAFDEEKKYKTPDRLSGYQTYNELKNCCPERNWNFVEINISKETLDNTRENNIADLIFPLNTVLDDSLGCALWFASNGVSTSYTSPCRVVLVGMGADELFGGYMRHKNAFRRNSWHGLKTVLDEDWQNISFRNLGRDDRVISDNGRQLRTPYLDENVVSYVRALNCWEKTYPSDDLPNGIGQKILLRCLCYHLGLKNAASLKKKALQFGSRIADPKEKAHNISSRLT